MQNRSESRNWIIYLWCVWNDSIYMQMSCCFLTLTFFFFYCFSFISGEWTDKLEPKSEFSHIGLLGGGWRGVHKLSSSSLNSFLLFLASLYTTTQTEAEQAPPTKNRWCVFWHTHRMWLRTAGVSEHGASSQIRIAGGRLEIWLLRQAAGCCPLLPAKQSLRY